AAERAPEDKEPLLALGEVLLKRGDPSRATTVLERAKALDADDPVIARTLGRAQRLTRLLEDELSSTELPAAAPPPTEPPPAAARGRYGLDRCRARSARHAPPPGHGDPGGHRAAERLRPRGAGARPDAVGGADLGRARSPRALRERARPSRLTRRDAPDLAR